MGSHANVNKTKSKLIKPQLHLHVTQDMGLMETLP